METIYTEQPIRVYQPISDKQFEVVDPFKPWVLKYNNMLYKLFDSHVAQQLQSNKTKPDLEACWNIEWYMSH